MYVLTVILHILACFALILIVLLQTGKGAEMGAAFGGASQTLFGGSGGTTFLGKLTTGAAIVFMITCIGLTYLSSAPKTKSVMESVPVQKSEGPVLPEAKPIQPTGVQTGPTLPEQSAKPAAQAENPSPLTAPREETRTDGGSAPQQQSDPSPAGKKQ